MTEAAQGSAPSSLGVPTLTLIVEAEIRKLASRVSFRVALAILLVLAIGGPCLEVLVDNVLHKASAASSEGALDAPKMIATYAVDGVLAVRDFFLLRGLLIWLIAESVGGELVSRTLRDDLSRPVTRGQVLAAKWLAIQVFVAASVLLPLVVSSLLSLLFFGAEAPWTDTLRSWAMSGLGDIGFSTLVFAIAFLVRGVGGTLVGVFLFWVLDQALGWFLYGVDAGRGIVDQAMTAWGVTSLAWVVDLAVQIRPWLPWSAFHLASSYTPDEPLVWQSWASLVIISTASYAFAWWQFRRMDID